MRSLDGNLSPSVNHVDANVWGHFLVLKLPHQLCFFCIAERQTLLKELNNETLKCSSGKSVIHQSHDCYPASSSSSIDHSRLALDERDKSDGDHVANGRWKRQSLLAPASRASAPWALGSHR